MIVSGGFGVNLGGCAPRILLTLLTIGLVIALIAGIVLGAVEVPTPALFSRVHDGLRSLAEHLLRESL